MNGRILYNTQKAIIEEVKQEFLKLACSDRQKNVIKETCNKIARKHSMDDIHYQDQQKDKLEDKIKFIHDMKNHTIDDEYDVGFYNGIEYALSILENREAVYKEYKKIEDFSK